MARQLHARVAQGANAGELQETREALEAERKISAQVLAEQERLKLQIDSLGRQLELERTARAKTATERDEWREKFLGQSTANFPVQPARDFSRQETKPYELGTMRQTDPSMPAVVVPDPLDTTQTDQPSPRAKQSKTQPFGPVAPAPTKPGKK